MMFINFSLFYLFSSFWLLSSIFVVFSINPIFSILFLIFSFCNASCLLFILNFEFLPIVFLVVYVGAIAILFLFILMMLNIKLTELHENFYNFLPISIIFGIIFIIELSTIFCLEFVSFEFLQNNTAFLLSDYLNYQNHDIKFLNFLTLQTNIKNLAQTIFSNYIFQFLLSGYILLFAMIATILITIQKTFIKKNQNIYYQILRDYKTAVINK